MIYVFYFYILPIIIVGILLYIDAPKGTTVNDYWDDFRFALIPGGGILYSIALTFVIIEQSNVVQNFFTKLKNKKIK